MNKLNRTAAVISTLLGIDKSHSPASAPTAYRLMADIEHGPRAAAEPPAAPMPAHARALLDMVDELNGREEAGGIAVGDRVRSFDFDSRDLEGERACYVEGVVEGIFEPGIAVWRSYAVRVTRRVICGEEEPKDVGMIVRPPVNGIRTSLGRVTDGVELLEASK